MRNEVQLLLCCARTCLDAARAARIRALLREEIDWEILLHKAVQHGIVPFLYQHLNATDPEAVPEAALERLRDLFNANTRRNLFLTGELLRLLSVFETHDIPAIPFKGPALAASVYGNLALRQFGDLDILVRKQDVLRAGDLLTSLGYEPQYRFTGARARSFLQSQCELSFTRDDGRLIVELQWEIVPRYFLSPLLFDRVWKRFDPIPKGDPGLPNLPPEETLLVLCVHGAKHVWERLEWICDVAELVRVHESLDWKWVMEQSRNHSSQRMLYLGILLASDLLGMALPEEVRQLVGADPAVKRLTGQVWKRLSQERDSSPGLLETCLFHLKALERLQDRIRYCVRLAMTTTPRDWALLPLPDLFFPFYIALRPVRLAWKFGCGSLRRIYDGGKGSAVNPQLLAISIQAKDED